MPTLTSRRIRPAIACGATLTVLTALSVTCWGQPLRGIVVDQTGLPLPGVSVQVLDNDVVTLSLTTGPDGTFDTGAARGKVVIASLDGFETAHVSRQDASRIILAIARATETTTVVAPSLPSLSPTVSTVGSALTATTVARLPSSRLKARESLPLLPSMVRGADGLLRLGGARPYETPLLLDGFNVTDPATGTSNINLPFETVQGVEVLRDPIAVTYGGLLGGLVQMVSKPGSSGHQFGVQGFVPRPRFVSPGVGRLEGIFPRVYVGGMTGDGRVQYMAAVEYDFERIAVPEVTSGSGPNLVEQSATMFGRLDLQPHGRYNITIEGLVFPSDTQNFGLSPRRDELASAHINQRDLFAGATQRIVLNHSSVLAIRVGLMRHDITLTPNGEGPARLSPLGWRANWFATIDRHASRYTAVVTWDRTMSRGAHQHAFTLATRVAPQRLRGMVAERPVLVEDMAGRIARRVEFGPPSRLQATDRPVSIAARDVWDVGSSRLQIDAGIRLDHDSSYGAADPSWRGGIRYAVDEAGLTVVRAGYGSFVGSLPLAVEAFAGQPTRIDTALDPETGAIVHTMMLQPTVDRLRLPRARSVVIQGQRQLRPGLDLQVGVTDRRSWRLATLEVPVTSGHAVVRSTGNGSYRELQFSTRKVWSNDQQLFVSYVRSSARGELNDFAALFQSLDHPLLQPGGTARLPADARHRWIAWGTFNLPRRIVVSPVIEWHSGFPYSIVDERYRYVGQPNATDFPAFMAADFVIYKTLTVRRRTADLGMQLFNVTNHFNPRDVYPVTGAPRFGAFTNGVGTIVRGFMLIKW